MLTGIWAVVSLQKYCIRYNQVWIWIFIHFRYKIEAKLFLREFSDAFWDKTLKKLKELWNLNWKTFFSSYKNKQRERKKYGFAGASSILFAAKLLNINELDDNSIKLDQVCVLLLRFLAYSFPNSPKLLDQRKMKSCKRYESVGPWHNEYKIDQIPILPNLVDLRYFHSGSPTSLR